MKFFSIILLGHFLFRLWLSSFGGLHPDEAYYWNWAQELKLGYFDHPPMIAWLIHLSNKLVYSLPFISKNSLAVQYIAFRCLPFFMGFVLTPFVLAKSIVFIQKKNLSLTQIFCLMTFPFVLGGAQVITPDIPLFFFWACALYLVLQIVKGRGRAFWSERLTHYQPRKAALLGVVLACAAYSKYTAVFLALLLPISGLGFYNSLTCAFFAAGLLVPHLVWSLQYAMVNNMGMFFQLGHSFNSFEVEPKLNYLLDLWGMQILLWGPFLFVFLIALISKRHKYVWILLWWTFLPLLFFSITSLRRYVEGNWPLMGAMAAAVWFLSAYRRQTRKIFFVGTGHFLLYILFVVALFNLSKVSDYIEPFSVKLSKDLKKPSRLNEFKGWGRLRDMLYEVTVNDQLPIAVDQYQTMSPLLFYDKLKPSEERLKTRLKIWHKARRSHYNYLPVHALSPNSSEYYLLTERKKKVPKDCQYLQAINKSSEVSFHLSKCTL